MPQELLNAHKFDDKSGVPTTGTDAELRDVVIEMLRQGHSDDEVRSFIQKVADQQSPGAARLAGGLKGLKGLVTGPLFGLPMMVKDAVADGVSILQGKDPENAKAFVESIHSFIPKLKEMGPREQAEAVTELASSFAGGIVGGGGAFAARKPIAKALGATLSEAAAHPGAVRLASGGAMLHGFYNGSPTEMGMGLAGMSVPDAVGGIGDKLYKYGSDGAKYVTRKARAAAQAAEDEKLPSSVRDIDTGPVKSLNLAPPTSGPKGTARVPQVGTPATANGRVQRVMADEAKAESAVAGRQAARASGMDSIPVPEGLSPAEAQSFREVKASNPQIPDRVIVQSIKGTSVQPVASVAPAGRPAIRVTGQPTETATAVLDPRITGVAPPVERRMRAGSAPGGTERRLAPTADDLPPTGTQAERAAAMRRENPAIDQEAAAMRAKAAVAERVPAPPRKPVENYMTEGDVANIGAHAAEMGDQTLNTLRADGRDVPEGGLQSTEDIDRVVGTQNLTETPAFKDLQESIRKSKEPVPTPSNLQMGSEASPTEMMADINPRVKAGGIRIDGSRPGQPIGLVKDALSDEAKTVLEQYIRENPEVDPAVAEAHLRKLIGSEE